MLTATGRLVPEFVLLKPKLVGKGGLVDRVRIGDANRFFAPVLVDPFEHLPERARPERIEEVLDAAF